MNQSEAHAKVMTYLKSASPGELFRTAIRAGIYTFDGKLTPEYGGKKRKYSSIKISTDDDHLRALSEIEALWDCGPGTYRAHRFDALASAVDAYEAKRWPQYHADKPPEHKPELSLSVLNQMTKEQRLELYRRLSDLPETIGSGRKGPAPRGHRTMNNGICACGDYACTHNPAEPESYPQVLTKSPLKKPLTPAS